MLFRSVIANVASGRIQHYRRASRQATGSVTGFIGEFFGAVQAVKVAGAEQNVIDHFNKLNNDITRYSNRLEAFAGEFGAILSRQLEEKH